MSPKGRTTRHNKSVSESEEEGEEGTERKVGRRRGRKGTEGKKGRGRNRTRHNIHTKVYPA